ncbi:PFK5 [Symbiodinium sp. CCMP2592]|nr:PFK5 [Symbiodinium sp. CCMP2592]
MLLRAAARAREGVGFGKSREDRQVSLGVCCAALFSSCGSRGSFAFLGSAGLDVLVTRKLPSRMATSAGVRRCQQAARFGPAWAGPSFQRRVALALLPGAGSPCWRLLCCAPEESFSRRPYGPEDANAFGFAALPFAWSAQALHSTTSQLRISGWSQKHFQSRCHTALRDCAPRLRSAPRPFHLSSWQEPHAGPLRPGCPGPVNKFLNPIAVHWPLFNFLNPAWSLGRCTSYWHRKTLEDELVMGHIILNDSKKAQQLWGRRGRTETMPEPAAPVQCSLQRLVAAGSGSQGVPPVPWLGHQKSGKGADPSANGAGPEDPPQEAGDASVRGLREIFFLAVTSRGMAGSLQDRREKQDHLTNPELDLRDLLVEALKGKEIAGPLLQRLLGGGSASRPESSKAKLSPIASDREFCRWPSSQLLRYTLPFSLVGGARGAEAAERRCSNGRVGSDSPLGSRIASVEVVHGAFGSEVGVRLLNHDHGAMGMEEDSEAFLSSLPPDDFTQEENILREKLFEAWRDLTSSDQREVSLLYLAEHPKVKRALGFLPAKMLRTWIEARLGAEMQLTENDDKELCCEFLNAPRQRSQAAKPKLPHPRPAAPPPKAEVAAEELGEAQPQRRRERERRESAESISVSLRRV